MADNSLENNQGNNQSITFNFQYLKDLSFESPSVPQIFSENETPETTVMVDVKAMRVQDNSYSVSLITNCDAKIKGRTAFICECEFCTNVTLNVPEEALETCLLIEVPKYLFPFVRNIISDTTRNGGFAPLLLNPIDFQALYEAKKQQQQN